MIFVILFYRVAKVGKAHGKKKIIVEANRELVCLAIYTVICGLSYTIKRKYAMEYFDVSLALTILIPIHYISSLITERVNINESAVVLFFGKVVHDIKHKKGSGGPVFVPPYTHELKRAPSGRQELEIPGKPGTLWRGELDQMPAGKKPVLRITTAESDDEKKLNELNIKPYEVPQKDGKVDEEKIDFLALDRLTTEIYCRVTYQIVSAGQFFRYFSTIEEFEDILENIPKSLMLNIIGKLTTGTVLKNIGSIEANILESIRGNIAFKANIDENVEDQDFGVDIKDFKLNLVDLSHAVNLSMTQRISARYNAKATIHTATGDAEAIRVKGIATGQAAAAPYEELAKIMSQHPHAREAYMIEKVSDAVSASKPVVFLGGNGDNTTNLLQSALASFLSSKDDKGENNP